MVHCFQLLQTKQGLVAYLSFLNVLNFTFKFRLKFHLLIAQRQEEPAILISKLLRMHCMYVASIRLEFH